MGPEYIGPGPSILHHGGILVACGVPQSIGDFLLLVVKLITNILLPNGKVIKGYGTHRESPDTFKEDRKALFALLKAGKIRPTGARRSPLLDEVKAYDLLETGRVTGNVVFLAPELLGGHT